MKIEMSCRCGAIFRASSLFFPECVESAAQDFAEDHAQCRNAAYKISQHDLCCEQLGVAKEPDQSGDTLYEAVVALCDSANAESEVSK